MEICTEFIAKAEQGDLVNEARKLLETVRSKSDKEFQNDAAKIRDYLKSLDFINAEPLATKLKGKFKGTHNSQKASWQAQRVNALYQLHLKTVKAVEETEKPKLLPFAVDTVGRGKAVNATMERLGVSFGELQQDLLWTKFTKDEVFQIYRMYLDERFKENQKLLEHFAKEFKIKGKYYQP